MFLEEWFVIHLNPRLLVDDDEPGEHVLHILGSGVQHELHPGLPSARSDFFPFSTIKICVLKDVEAQGTDRQTQHSCYTSSSPATARQSA